MSMRSGSRGSAPLLVLLSLAPFAAAAAQAQAPLDEWYLLGAHQQPPLPRRAALLADARHDRLLMIGGERIDSTGFTRQAPTVFAIGGLPMRDWAPLFEGSGDVPLRSSAGAVHDSLTDRVLLWGGARIFPSGLVAPFDADLFRMDAAGVWTREPAGSPAPRPRRDHGFVQDRVRRRVFAYGGRDFLDEFLGDVWVRDSDLGAAWDSVETVGTPPLPRMNAVVLFDDVRERLLVMGGEGFGPTRFSDAWQLDFRVTPPRWSALPNVAGRLSGPMSAAVDRARDRALVLPAERDSTYAWRFDTDALSPGVVLQVPPVFSGYGLSGSPRIAVSDRWATAVSSAPYGVWVPGESRWRFSRARPLAAAVPAQFTVAAPTARFALGLTTLSWLATAAGLQTLPQPSLPGQPAVPLPDTALRTASGYFPDMGGALFHDRTALAAGRTHTVGLAWWNGTAFEATPYASFATPPGPLTVNVVLDSIFATGDGITSDWRLGPVDSLRQYAPTQLERRMDGGAWVTFAPGAFPDTTGRFLAFDRVSAPGHAFEYRIRWESPAGTRQSEPQRFAWIDAPAFEGIEARADSFVALWRVPAGVPFRVQLLGLRPGASPIVIGADAADALGAIRVAVRPVRPDTLYRLMGTWVNGGLARTGPAFQYQSGLSTITRVALSVRGGIGTPATLRFIVPAGEYARTTLHDVSGRIVWAVSVPPGVFDVRPDPEITPSGLYFARITHTTGTATARVVIVQ